MAKLHKSLIRQYKILHGHSIIIRKGHVQMDGSNIVSFA